jgi:predicted peptidase
LHGLDEGPPTPIWAALKRHGPLADTASPMATAEFTVLAPQLPTRGDRWHRHADALREIVRGLQATQQVDPGRAFLTGFSYGANGVFDLALVQRDLWAALWPVDPTRVPDRDPGLAVWLSSGEVSRGEAQEYIDRLRLEQLGEGPPGERVYADQGQDHVGTATLAYQDERIYRWLLSQGRPTSES